ncbi:SGNH/GDSL hydrolase family protein, partial [Clavibacter michiganensis]|uniref:hypothetical protein n=1 Tax=Clavibacter michiganensis TaxID=28447 RepID=UPI002931DE3C
NKVADGLDRDLTTTPPDVIGINIGTNDQRNGISSATFTTALTSLLNAIIAATPRTTRIVVFLPFGGHYGATVYQNAIAATTKPRRCWFVNTVGWWNTLDAAAALHPYGFANQSRLAPLAAAALREALNAGRTFRKVDGELEAIRASRY